MKKSGFVMFENAALVGKVWGKKKKGTGRNEDANPGQVGNHPHYAKEGAPEESLEGSKSSPWAFLGGPNPVHQAKQPRLLKLVPGFRWW